MYQHNILLKGKSKEALASRASPAGILLLAPFSSRAATALAEFRHGCMRRPSVHPSIGR